MARKLTAREACERLAISRQTLWKWREAGIVTTFKNVRGQLRFDPLELDRVFSRS